MYKNRYKYRKIGACGRPAYGRLCVYFRLCVWICCCLLADEALCSELDVYSPGHGFQRIATSGMHLSFKVLITGGSLDSTSQCTAAVYKTRVVTFQTSPGGTQKLKLTIFKIHSIQTVCHAQRVFILVKSIYLEFFR